MAKKKKNSASEDSVQDELQSPVKKDKKKKRGLGCLIPSLLFFILIGGLVAAIWFNLFGIRTNYLSGIISQIPFVNTLFPDDSGEVAPIVPTKSSDEYESEISQLNDQITQLNEQLKLANDANTKNLSDLSRLSELEDQQLQFKEDQQAFDTAVAEGDPEAFIQFYESMNPENAANLYKEAVANREMTAELRSYVNTVTSMDEGDAASMLEEMIATDMDLVVLVLENIDAETRGAVLGSMTPANSASVYKQMAPEQQASQ